MAYQPGTKGPKGRDLGEEDIPLRTPKVLVPLEYVLGEILGNSGAPVISCNLVIKYDLGEIVIPVEIG